MGWSTGEIIQFATIIIPLVDQVIKWVEKLFPRSEGQGKKKRALSVIKAVLPEGREGGIEGEQVISNLIDSRVAMMNEARVFKHHEKAKA